MDWPTQNTRLPHILTATVWVSVDIVSLKSGDLLN